MGFRRGRRTYKLFFDEHTEFEGLEFRALGVTIGQAAYLSSPECDSAELAKVFAEHLLEWNYEDEDTGAELPPTWESVNSIDADIANTMAFTWLREVAGVRRPLGKPSSSGAMQLPPGGLPAEAMPMMANNSTAGSTTASELPPQES